MRNAMIDALATLLAGEKGDAQAIPESVLPLLGKPPLIKGESIGQYHSLFASLVAELAPGDAIEWLWTKDIVDLTWEARRLSHVKISMINLSMFGEAERFVEPLLNKFEYDENESPEDNLEWRDAAEEEASQKARRIFVNYQKGSSAAGKRLRKVLSSDGLDEATILATAVVKRLELSTQLDAIILSYDKRRNQILRDFDQRRAHLKFNRPRVLEGVSRDVELQEGIEVVDGN